MSTESRARSRRWGRRSTSLLAAVALLPLGGCALFDNPDSTGDGDGRIVFWNTEGNPDRLERTQRNIDAFTAATGIEVEQVAVDESDLFTLILVNAASGTLPDVVRHPTSVTTRWVEQGLLDASAATEVIENLGPETFAEDALTATALDGEYGSVPIDGFGIVTHYRTDRFTAAGLAPPTTYDAILEAARALHDPSNNQYGITLTTDPANEATQTRFEHIALANGCDVVDSSGAVALDSPECVEAFEFESELRQYAPQGIFNSSEARAAYLAGQAAMTIEGPSTLHRLAGLDDSQLATCPECTDNPQYLSENTGLLATITGPSGEPSQFGQVLALGISVDAEVDAAQRFIEYLLGDGYSEWLAQAPNTLLPARLGTPEEPERFVDEWRALEVGVERKALLDTLYGTDAVDELLAGSPQNFDGWSLQHPALTGALYEAFTVPQVLAEMAEGLLTPQEAAQRAAAEAAEILDGLEG